MRESVRQAVFQRDDFRCRYCGSRWVDYDTGDPICRYYDPGPNWWKGNRWIALLHVDHVKPRSKGGTDDIDNLVTACCKCNLEKYDNPRVPRELETWA